MSLLKYFLKQPSARALHGESDLTNKENNKIDKRFQRAMKEELKKSVAGWYNKYMPEERASTQVYLENMLLRMAPQKLHDILVSFWIPIE